MPSRSAARYVTQARGLIVPLGLSPAELALVQTAAAGRFALVPSRSVQPILQADAVRHEVVHVASVLWWTGRHADPAFAPVLERIRMVLLMPSDTLGEQQRQLAEQAPNALLVILGERGAAHALYSAIDVVRNHAVADALLRRIGDALGTTQVATRALCAAVELLPAERSVPALARSLFLSERSLRRQLDNASPGLTPKRVLSWATLLHAAWHLEAMPGDSFDRAARSLGASSPGNLRRLLRARTGLKSRTLRAQCARPVDRVLAAWVEERGRDIPRCRTS